MVVRLSFGVRRHKWKADACEVCLVERRQITRPTRLIRGSSGLRVKVTEYRKPNEPWTEEFIPCPEVWPGSKER